MLQQHIAIGTLPSDPLDSFQMLLKMLPQDRISIFNSTLEHIYWVAHPM